MISNNSKKNFFIINTFLILIGSIQHLYLLNYNNLFIIFVGFLIRNIVMERGLNYMLKNKEYINPEYDRENIVVKNYPSIILHYFTSTIVEVLTNYFIYKYYTFGSDNFIYDIIILIPISFVYEIIFDFFHYTMHRLEHTNNFLYKYIHKVHHTYSHPTTELTYYHHPLDLILTNTVPQYLTLCIIPKISKRIYNLIIIYKIFIEISGHAGKNVNACSFHQFIWLPKLLGIEMYTEDHDTHHKLNNCNYAKRFTLWDKFFNTYNKSYTNEKNNK